MTQTSSLPKRTVPFRQVTFKYKLVDIIESEGKLVIAVVLPFRPYVERGGINNQPVIDVKPFQSSSRQHCDQLEAFVKAVQDR